MTFGYTQPELDAVERFLTSERLSRYLSLTRSGDRVEALKLYEQNTKLSEAFYTPLQGLEVCLRNSANLQLIASFGPTWFKNKRGIFEHPLTEMLQQAEDSLLQDGKSVTSNGMVAGLSFGFWVSVLSPRYDSPLWRPSLHRCFPNRPKGTERKVIHKQLNALRRLRNRIAHHEPILQRDLKHDHEMLMGIVTWMCKQTALWIEDRSQIPPLLGD